MEIEQDRAWVYNLKQSAMRNSGKNGATGINIQTSLTLS